MLLLIIHAMWSSYLSHVQPTICDTEALPSMWYCSSLVIISVSSLLANHLLYRSSTLHVILLIVGHRICLQPAVLCTANHLWYRSSALHVILFIIGHHVCLQPVSCTANHLQYPRAIVPNCQHLFSWSHPAPLLLQLFICHDKLPFSCAQIVYCLLVWAASSLCEFISVQISSIHFLSVLSHLFVL